MSRPQPDIRHVVINMPGVEWQHDVDVREQPRPWPVAMERTS